MPDTKISALTAATSVNGTEVLPIVQSATTKKSAISLIKDYITGTANTFTASQTIASGTLTASAPALDVTQTWNSAGTTFTALKFNVTDTASQSGSLLTDLQVGGTSQFYVTKTGNVLGNNFFFGKRTDTSITFSSGTTSLFVFAQSSTASVEFSSTSLGILSSGSLSWSSTGAVTNSKDLTLFRDAANTLAQRNGTNAQVFRLYNTFTDASNYERGKIEWASNVLRIGTEKAGTGTARALELQTDGTTRVTISATGTLTHSGIVTSSGQTYYYGNGGDNGLGITNAYGVSLFTNGSVTFASNAARAAFYNGSLQAVSVSVDADYAFAQRSGTNPQTFRVYNTYTSSTSYERAKVAWESNVLTIGTEKGSGGGTARALELQTDGATATTIDTSGNLIQKVNGTAPTLGTNGTMSFELTSNTSLKIVVRGSDGTTRSASLTLA